MLNKFLLLCCLALAPLSAETASELPAPQDNSATVPATNEKVQINAEVTQGYRVDRYSWHIGSHHKKPHVTLKGTAHQVQIYQTRLASKLSYKGFFANFQGGYGDILHGHARDSAYTKHSHNKSMLHSRATINGSYVWDAKITLGRPFTIFTRYSVSPLLGYFWQLEKFRTHGHTKVRSGKYFLHTHGSNSSYRTRWDAPFIGAQGTANLTSSISLSAEYNFLFEMRHTLKGHLNGPGIRFSNSSERHRTLGNVGIVGAGYKFLQNWLLQVEYQFSHFVAKGGHSTEAGKSGHSPFKKALLTSQEVRLALTYAF